MIKIDLADYANATKQSIFENHSRAYSGDYTNGSIVVYGDTLAVVMGGRSNDRKTIRISTQENPVGVEEIRIVRLSEILQFPEWASIVVNPVGGWMPLGDNKIVLEVKKDVFGPPTTSADIVVCENQLTPDYGFVDYLKKKYPNRTIKIVRLFSSLTLLEVAEEFKDAEIIAFSTTFSNYDWLEKALFVAEPHQMLVGYCKERALWDFPAFVQTLATKFIDFVKLTTLNDE